MHEHGVLDEAIFIAFNVNILFIIQTHGSQTLDIVRANLAYCASHNHRFFTVEINDDEENSISSEKNSTAGHLRLARNFKQPMYSRHNEFLKIIDGLKQDGFTPNLVEFYDEYDLAYLIAQNILTQSAFAQHAKMILNITNQKPLEQFTIQEENSLPEYFKHIVLQFLLNACDAAFCYHPQGFEFLSKKYERQSARVEQVFFDSRSADLVFQRKYKFFVVDKVSKKGPPKNKYYPFALGKELSIPISADAPLLSIVIPYFNMGAYIDETIASILNSTYKNIEIILVNDGSTEPATNETLNRIEQQHPAVRVFNQQNSGVAAARNNGIAAAQGEIIALLDADDLVAPHYYQKAVELLKRFDNVGFVGCWTEFFNESGVVDHWITHNPEPPLFFLLNTINTQAIVVKKAALEKYGLHDGSLNMMLDDWESAINMLVHGIRGIVIPEFLFHYRIRTNSVYRSHADQWIKSYQKILTKHFDNLQAYSKDLLLLLTANGPNIFYKAPELLPDYYRIMTKMPNFRIRDSLLTKLINQYYNFVELNPLGIKIRNALKPKQRTVKASSKDRGASTI
jgi:glycosyltransferase involved in cell wall biosynthesis